jgi:hypothetical protein
MDGAPPREIFDGGQMPFGVNVVIDNLGESAVGPEAPTLQSSDRSTNTFALVQIIGINPAQFGYPELEKTFADEGITLLGARRNFDGTVVSGDKNVITFEKFNYLPDERGNSQVTLRANICYDYTTYSRGIVCIKDNVLESTQDSTICTLSGPKDVKSSGAPVHVTSLTENPLGRNKIQVTFTVENVGTGQIFRRESQNSGLISDACDTSLTNPNKNIVHVKVFLGDDYSSSLIQCPLLGNSNEGDIQLFQGAAATLSCTIQTDPNRNRVYTDKLYINLEYTYLQFVETPILIRDVSVGSAP